MSRFFVTVHLPNRSNVVNEGSEQLWYGWPLTVNAPQFRPLVPSQFQMMPFDGSVTVPLPLSSDTSPWWSTSFSGPT